jgi:cysteinyl-tRNA synthetase
MPVRFFNSLSRRVEEFIPLDPSRSKVHMYCCGPTVYDFGHIGNFRTFVFSDLVRRFLEFRGYQVTAVMNITDVEDKIIQRVRAARATLRAFVSPYEDAFLADMQTLGCRRPHHLPRATEHIPEMIRLIEALMNRGIAYQAADRSIYFSIEKYQRCGCRYGQLVSLNFDQMRVGDRVASDEYSKEAVADFALWKARVPEDGDVFWLSPWGEGRPGWHIECSAMSMKLLGASFDLHLGGEDLAFPHHEDEIAQSEGAGLQIGGGRFVKYWLHAAHLLVDGKKMSKSLGNFHTLRDLLAKGYGGREIRQLLLSAHYRETCNFTFEGLDASRVAIARLDECLGKLRELAGKATSSADPQILNSFTQALDEDLNVSQAWGVVFEWVRELNRLLAASQLSPEQAAAALSTWDQMDQVLGLGQRNEVEAPPEVLSLLEQRQAARKAKDFKKADALRDQLKSLGWLIEDTPKGAKVKRADS